MKIALLTDGIHPYVIGGMQKHSYYLARYFSLNGISVDLYHTSFRSNRTEGMVLLDCFSNEERKNIHSIPINFPKYMPIPGHYVRESYAYSCAIFNAFKEREAVDFVYAKGFSGWKLIEEKAKGYSCAKVGVNFHGYEMFQKASSIKSIIVQYLLKPPVRYISTKADCIFSYGGGITTIIKELQVLPEKIIEVPAAIESTWLVKEVKKTETIRKFLFVGRYEERKGIQELTQAIEQLSNSNCEFHFVGEIPSAKKTKQSNVFYHGKITEVTSLQNRMCSCDVLLCPSYSEGMPNVILEAMASGLAIVATDVGAINLMVSEKNGWLLKSPSVSNILIAIINAMKCSHNELDARKQNSIEAVKTKFLWNHAIHKLIDDIKLVSF